MLSRLCPEERQRPLFVWTENDIDKGVLSVELSDGASAWQGSLSRAEVEKYAELSKMSPSSFLDQTKLALSGKRKHECVFVYSATHGKGGELQFVWKKVSGGIKFQLGKITLKPVPNETVNSDLLNHCLDDVDVLEEKVAELSKRCEQFKNERQLALERLNTCTSAQETLETEMYGKFKLLLNEKKGKIRKLMESKAYLTEQNEEMQRQIWEMKTRLAAPAEKGELEEMEQNHEVEFTKPSTTSSTDLESLLNDAPLKPPSPPPTKKRQLSRGARRGGKVEIPQPPSLHLHHPTESDNSKEMSLDSSDLLDML